MADLDKLFSPSQWSKKTPGIQRCINHIKFIEKYSQQVKENIPCKLNIPYDSGKRQLIDLYGINLPEESPVFIHIHGGYWQETQVTQSNNSFISKNLYANGIKSLFIGYELCPDVTLDQIINSIEKAVHFCLNSLIDLNKTRGIHLSGHSAGAHLAAILFKNFIPSLPKGQQSLFKSAFLIAGIYDLLPLLQTSNNDLLRLDKETAVNASPLHQKLLISDCKMFVIVAEYDCPKFIEQGHKMYNHLSDLGFESKLVFLKCVDHFDVIEDLNDAKNNLIKLMINNCNN